MARPKLVKDNETIRAARRLCQAVEEEMGQWHRDSVPYRHLSAAHRELQAWLKAERRGYLPEAGGLPLTRR